MESTPQTFFAYSDEYGSYQEQKTDKFLRAHPFYIRSVILLDSNEWKILDSKVRSLKRKHGLPPDGEVKWAHLWGLRRCQTDKKEIHRKHPFYFLRNIDYHVLIAYVDEVLAFYSALGSSKAIFTVTANRALGSVSAERLYLMHLTNIAQRLQYELQSSGSLAVLFFDSVSESVDRLLKDGWHAISNSSDYVQRYTCIKRSAYVEHSHQSPGMQVSDYVAGVVGSYIKAKFSGQQTNYAHGISMFENHIRPILRNNPANNQITGYGVLNVPTQSQFKAWMLANV
jgi:hypothetical protein